MTGMERARYTLEFKQEAVRLVRGGQSLSSVARGLGVSAQSIDNWVKADAIGGLKEAKGKPVNADQMEIARLRSELAKTRMEREILKKAAVGSTGRRNGSLQHIGWRLIAKGFPGPGVELESDGVEVVLTVAR